MDWHEILKLAQVIFASGVIIYVLYGLYYLADDDDDKKKTEK